MGASSAKGRQSQAEWPAVGDAFLLLCGGGGFFTLLFFFFFPTSLPFVVFPFHSSGYRSCLNFAHGEGCL
jgi:hypothetical protein